GARTLSNLPERPGVRPRSRVCLLERGFQGKNLHLPDQQEHPAPRNSEGAGAIVDCNRQNRSSSEVCFQERASILGAPQIGKWKSRFRIRRKKTKEERAAQSSRGLTEQQFQALKIVDATRRGVLFSLLTLCVAPSAG